MTLRKLDHPPRAYYIINMTKPTRRCTRKTKHGGHRTGAGRPPTVTRTRDRLINIRLTARERATIVRAAGGNVSQWLRELALAAATSKVAV